MSATEKTIGIYIHVPFCASKCPYCDFYSVSDKSMIDGFTAGVAEELNTLRRTAEFTEGIKNASVGSVYFGGGTPSYIGADKLCFLLKEVRENFNVLPGAQVTAECNPSTLSDGFFVKLRQCGFDRISMGMQSAVDSERRTLGRKAGAADVARAVAECKKAGFEDISLDVMLGVPGQTEESLISSLDFALAQGITHLSAYILSLEEGTFFYKKRDLLGLPSEDDVCDMYAAMCVYLKKAGMRHYEISNFCFDGFVSRHNMLYWNDGEYLGIGPAAHSFYNGRRFYFTRDLRGFITGAPAVFDCTGGDVEEYIMLKLRLDTGVLVSEVKEKYGISPNNRLFTKLEKYADGGLLRFDGDRVVLTDRGFLLSNTLIGEITEEFIQQRI